MPDTETCPCGTYDIRDGHPDGESCTLHGIATRAAARFETRTRDDGSRYVTLSDDRPEWLHDLVRDAHGADAGDMMLPDDWRYATIRAAVEAIAEEGEDVDPDRLDDLAHDFADGNVDHLNSELIAWLGSHAYRPGYCDTAAEDLGADPHRGILGMVQLGQYAESREVFESVARSLRELADV